MPAKRSPQMILETGLVKSMLKGIDGIVSKRSSHSFYEKYICLDSSSLVIVANP